MKYLLLTFIKLIFIFSIVCSIGMVASIWFITREPVALSEYLEYGGVGAIGGVWIGAGIWFVFYLQVRKYNRK